MIATEQPIDMDLTVRENVRCGLHDASFVLSSSNEFSFNEGTESSDSTKITFSTQARGGRQYSLSLQVGPKDVPARRYSLNELELVVVRLTASDTPLIQGVVDPKNPTVMTFPGLFVDNTYVFQSQEPGAYPLDRPAPPGQTLKVKVPEPVVELCDEPLRLASFGVRATRATSTDLLSSPAK